MGTSGLAMMPIISLVILSLGLCQAFVLDSRIPVSRVPNSCTTQTGATCVFPFKYKDVEYTQCSYAESPVPWCATLTDSAGAVVTNSWGDCQISTTSSCTSESLSITPCTTTTGATCQFPFRYNGVVYSQCATVDQPGPWCSTTVTAAGEHVPGNEGTCPATCPVVGGGSGGSGGSGSSPCTPGTSFTVDCNTCVCNSLGEAVCTTNTCTGSSTTTTTTTTTSTTTTTTTTTVAPSSSCVVSSGPAA